MVQEAHAQITWATNIVLLSKVNDPNERLWYAQKTVENGWSRNVLGLQIEQELYHMCSSFFWNWERDFW
ncbi:MAG: DUF1016 domain-containing protein [Smithella sp.]|nr:DUF1016 domain-containing protein [Smithella sp.]